MPRLRAIELVFDGFGEDLVRQDWHALHEAGLPSMRDHTGATNTPHVTVVALPAIDAAFEARAVDHIGSLLPLVVRPGGLALFGGDRVTLARLLDVPIELTHAVLTVRAGEAERHPGWLPHVTLGRRIPRASLQDAVEACGHLDHRLTLVAVRRWDPERGEVRLLAP